MKHRFALLLIWAVAIYAQTGAPKSVLGSISAFVPDSAEIEIKPESGDPVTVKISTNTVAKKVTPGQTDLSKAETINVTDVSLGDRVLVTLSPDQKEARRIIVMPANDIAKRDAADRADWQRRGVAGVVTGISGNDIAVEFRTFGPARQFTVTVGLKTKFKRYPPDSVRYADAKPATLAELSVGDKIRARGEKSSDGAKVAAEDVVFGTFLSRAGTITAVNATTREVTLKDLATRKSVTVRFTPDSQVKRLPAATSAAGTTQGMPTARGGAPPPSAPGRGAVSPDIAQMIEQLPPVGLGDLQTGEVVVVSAIRGARPDEITAITFLANAEQLVRIAMAASGASGPAPGLAGLAGSISNVGP